MSEDIQELNAKEFNRAITREQRHRLTAGDWEPGDLSALRRYLNLTQKQFAHRIGISVDTLQNWEQGRRRPEGPARALLRILAKHPRLVMRDLEQAS